MKYGITVSAGTVRLCNGCDPRNLRLINRSGTVEYSRGEDYEVDASGALTVRAGGALRPGDAVTVICGESGA